LDINNALQRKDKALLRALFTNWGLDIDSAAAVVDALVDWVDPDSNEELNGAENSYYVQIGQPNRPFNKKFSHLEELMLVRGFSQVAEFADVASVLDALRVDPSPEIRETVSSKIQLGGRARRVISVGTAANTQKEILAVVRFNGKQAVLIHSEEKTIYQEE